MRDQADLFLNQTMIGTSESFMKTLDTIRIAAKYDAGVYITGETGTGKELAARAVHYCSQRRNAPFVAVNCGALTDDLLYNEMFGHIRGSYSGAVANAAGLVEASDGGTLFLDEVDSLSPKFQVTLLRFLQEREYKPIGSAESKSADIRVICASNQDLRECVSAGTFRNDLLFRIDLLRIELPPVYKRKGDIPLLTDYFIKKLSGQYGFAPQTFSETTMQWMESYRWPGNIRELENFVLKQCLVGEHVGNDDAGDCSEAKENDLRFSMPFNEEKERVIRNFEYAYLENVLVKTNGNVSRAAELAGKERSCFSKLLKKYRLEKKSAGGNV